MAIKKFHRAGCADEKSCACPWRLTYRPLGTAGPMKRLNFPTRKAAERYQADTTVKASRGEYVDPGKVPTFAVAAERWFQSKADRRPSHVSDLRSRLDGHLLPKLGKQRLDRVSVADIEKLRSELWTNGYARRTVNTIVRIAGAVFKAAIRRGECSQNPVDRIERSFSAAREVTADDHGTESDSVHPDEILSPDEVRRLLTAAEPGLFRTLFMTAFITGMRSGELLGLSWGDVELGDGRGKIFVRKTLSRARVDRSEKVRPRFFPPKTKAGLRTIPISATLVSALKIWKLACPSSPDDLVFPREDGRPQARDTVLKRAFLPALRRAGLRRVVFHSLRHSCASAMIAAGAPITEIQHRLGHASPAITLAVYSHWFRNAESGAADQLEAAVLGESVHKVCTEPDTAKVVRIGRALETTRAVG